MANRLTLDMNEYFAEVLKVNIRKDAAGNTVNASFTIPAWLTDQLKLSDKDAIRVYFAKVKS